MTAIILMWTNASLIHPAVPMRILPESNPSYNLECDADSDIASDVTFSVFGNTISKICCGVEHVEG